MSHYKEISPSHCKKATYIKVLNNIPINFTIEYTIFGEVLHIENEFKKLPLAAQKMMFNQRERRRLDALEAGLFYLIPLAIQRKFTKAEWSEFAEPAYFKKNQTKTQPQYLNPEWKHWNEQIKLADPATLKPIEQLLDSDTEVIKATLFHYIDHPNQIVWKLVSVLMPYFESYDLDWLARRVIRQYMFANIPQDDYWNGELTDVSNLPDRIVGWGMVVMMSILVYLLYTIMHS